MSDEAYFLIPIIDTSSGNAVTVAAIKIEDAEFGDCVNIVKSYIKEKKLTGRMSYRVFVSSTKFKPTDVCVIKRSEGDECDEYIFTPMEKEDEDDVCVLS